MLIKGRTRQAHREGFRQGMLTALLVSSPFIVAGVKWMLDHADPMTNRIRETDLYTQVFNRKAHEEKQANRKLQQFRDGEGNYNDFDVEASAEEDEQLFSILKQIVKNEISKKNEE